MTKPRLVADSANSNSIQGDRLVDSSITGSKLSNDIPSSKVTFKQNLTSAITQTVESKLRTIVSVKDFGAIGSGSVDDTDAIQRAVDYVLAAGGGQVIIPPGTYLVTRAIVIDKSESLAQAGVVNLGISIRGENNGSSQIVRSVNYTTGPTFYVGPTNPTANSLRRAYVIFSDLQIRCQTPSLPPPNYTSAHIHLNNVIWYHIVNLTFFQGACNLRLSRSGAGVVSDCFSDWTTNSVSIEDRHMVVIDDYFGLHAGDIFFDNCNIRAGTPTPNVSAAVAKSVMWVKCVDGLWLDSCHLQGGDRILWLDSSISNFGVAGVRVANCWLDIIEGNIATDLLAQVYISGNASPGQVFTFSDCVFLSGNDYRYGVLCEGDTNLIGTLQVDNSLFSFTKREAIKINSSSTQAELVQITNNSFTRVQSTNTEVDKPVITLGNVENAVVTGNSVYSATGIDSFVKFNAGVDRAVVTNNLPTISSGYTKAIIAASGVSVYQIANGPVLLPGPYADNAGAATGNVPVGAFYRDSNGVIKQRTA